MGGRIYKLQTLPFIGIDYYRRTLYVYLYVNIYVLRYSRNGENFSRTVKSGCFKKALYANHYILK